MSQSYRRHQFETSLETNRSERFGPCFHFGLSDSAESTGIATELESRLWCVYGCMCSIVACCRCLRRTGRNRIKSVVISRMDRRESKGSF